MPELRQVKKDPTAFQQFLSLCAANSLAYLRLSVQHTPVPVFHPSNATAESNEYRQAGLPFPTDRYVEMFPAKSLRVFGVRPVLILSVDHRNQTTVITFAPLTRHNHAGLNQVDRQLWAPIAPAIEGYEMDLAPLQMKESMWRGCTIWCGLPLQAELHASGQLSLKVS